MKKIITLGLCCVAAVSFASPLEVNKIELGVGVNAVISTGHFKLASSKHNVRYNRDGSTLYVEIPENTKHIGWWHSLFHKRNIVTRTVSIHVPHLRAINLEPLAQVHVRKFKVNNFDLHAGPNHFKLKGQTDMQLTYKNKSLSADLDSGKISEINFAGRASVKANNFIASNLSFNSSANARMDIKAKDFKVDSLDWNGAHLHLDTDSINPQRISAYGAVTIKAKQLLADNFYVNASAGRVALKGSGFSFPSFEITPSTINMQSKQGVVGSLSTSGAAKVMLSNVQYKKHALEIKHSGVARLNLYGSGKVEKIESTNKGVAMSLTGGKLSSVSLRGKVKFVATDTSGKTLRASNGRDSLKVAGYYHIDKLTADSRRINLLLAQNAVLTQMHVRNDAAVFGPGLRAQRGIKLASIANGRVVLVGNVTASERQDSRGRAVVTLADGNLEKLMVRGKVRIVGTDINSKNLVVNAKSGAQVILEGNLGLTAVLADNSGPVSISRVSAKDLQVVATGGSKVSLSGSAVNVQAQLYDNAKLYAPNLKVAHAYVRSAGSASADVWVADMLRAFAYDTSNIYYYITPDQLTRDSNQRGNVLRVYSDLSRKVMFQQASKGFGDQM